MATIGFHASHELYSPSNLIRSLHLARELGFGAGMCSDHFHPWSTSGQSGFAWSWLGAALQSTDLTMGVVCAPGQRYNPAMIAQASTTLAEMFPDRFWIAVGTGQNLNEHITGQEWIDKPNRQKRLLECVDIMRRLWAGETVSTRGLVDVARAKLYTLPDRPPKIIGAAITDETAEWVGSWADGLITVAKPPEELAKTIAAFKRGGGEGKPMYLQSAIAFDADEDRAKAVAYEQWGVASLSVDELQDVATPEEFDRRVAAQPKWNACKNLRVSSNIDRHIEWIRNDLDLGFDAVFLHMLSRDLHASLQVFAQDVLPKV